ncbi:peptidoglycan bridge formation glycyltransferase FemA/FemB family protein [Candidatus Woesebacteria bacterium]|nr:peptidoglycan bridge formation glycyltransferase FemA/FemB family protein [Candidatus Woesebacteria bacterium]MCD8507155.1 peptidoglycan bridge formation glycyltransferase FemA/FemB family protein [Candidatus Woesebacteria bacterium]MCD8527046.1 peptidoglycan bridge formation glycyltransferase FemA/FemB family protein [Candidatus Woesebacteria bacterium]MCD8545952.1 peptidoglycan bridge formation glycyltransferase FemA/FemB family protein [Candidatus Woesebacteria bacterium]
MIIRPITLEEKERFNAVAAHPLQSWEWGEFRQATGQSLERLGIFGDNGALEQALSVTFHKIPVLGGTAGYMPKGPRPTPEMLHALSEVGRRQGCVFIKLEPNVQAPVEAEQPFADLEEMLSNNSAQPGRSLFTRYTFVKDLSADEETMLAGFKSKTRYNIRLAERKGVEVVEDTTQAGLEEYIRLLEETTARQGFYAHGSDYFRTMWKVLCESGMLRILKATYEGKTLSAWILFLFNGVGYYPYGASSREHREVMANNLMMWEALKLAKREGCTSFDMWGSLGPNPDSNHKWYGFHKFKEGYDVELVQSLPTHDLVINSPIYSLFTLGDSLRWKWLRFRVAIGK